MPGALQLGTLSYNGINFPPAADVDVSYNYSLQSSGMDKLYDVWTFRVSCVISSTDLGLSNGASIDSEFTEVRHALNQHGKTFVYQGHGIGTFPQNGNNGFEVNAERDLDFGPKTRLLRFKNIGQGRACEIEWECVCVVACCEDGRLNSIGEFSYGISWSWDNNLITTRTINGTIVARAHRKVGPPDTIDESNRAEKFYEDEVVKKVKWLEGFHRNVQRSLSPNRTTLSFTITDTEVDSDNPLEPNIVTASLDHTVNSTAGSIVAGMWSATLSGNYRVAPKVPKSVAWQAFRKIWQQRQGAASSAVILVSNFSARESIYGRDVSFSVTWTFTASLSSIFARSGMWTPVDATWKDWTASLDKIAGAFGPFNLSHKDGKDIILTFCNEDKPKEIPNIGSPGEVLGADTQGRTLQGQGYLAYENSVRFYRASNTVMIQKTGDGDAKNPLTVDGGSGRVSPGSGSTAKNEIQDRGRSALYMELKGRAVRVGAPPQVPGVSSIDGQNVAPVYEDVRQAGGKADAAGTPVFTATWKKVYYVAFGNINATVTGTPTGLSDSSGSSNNPGNLIPSQQPTVGQGVVVDQ